MHNILVMLKTGSCEGQSLCGYDIYKSFDERPSDNDLVSEIRNMLTDVLVYEDEQSNKYSSPEDKEEFTIFDYFKLENHEIDMESMSIMGEYGWTDHSIEDLSTLINEHGCGYFTGNHNTIQLNEIVFMGCIERVLEHDVDFFNLREGKSFVFDSGDFFRVKINE